MINIYKESRNPNPNHTPQESRKLTPGFLQESNPKTQVNPKESRNPTPENHIRIP